MAEKDYTSTIMRIAGNIAAGFVERYPLPLSHDRRDLVAATSADIAQRIVAVVLKEQR